MTPSDVAAQLAPHPPLREIVDTRDITGHAVTSEGLTRRDVNLYGIYTLHELAKLVPYRYPWLLQMTRIKDHPLPTIKRGAVQTIVYADFLEWLRELYGLEGIYRGQEILELGRKK